MLGGALLSKNNEVNSTKTNRPKHDLVNMIFTWVPIRRGRKRGQPIKIKKVVFYYSNHKHCRCMYVYFYLVNLFQRDIFTNMLVYFRIILTKTCDT